MKKSNVVLLSIIPLMLCSCGTTTKGVQGKAFTYSSCRSEAVKTGTSEAFYSENNKLGNDKDTIVNYVVNGLYYHGYDTSGIKELSFRDVPNSGYTYNGKATDVYEFNYTEKDEYNAAFGGYYINLNSDFTSIKLLKNKNLEMGDFYYTLYYDAYSQNWNGNKSLIGSKIEFTDTSITYSDKKLIVNVDVIFTNYTHAGSEINTMSYSLEFAEKII